MSLHNTSTRVTAVTGRASNGSASRGFSLIELMVAMALGLVLSIGVVSLFGSTSMSNKVQNSLARLQENGRYAVARMESDLRMQIGQYCSTTMGESRLADLTTPTWVPRSPMVYAASMPLPDSGKALSIDAGNSLSTTAASAPFPFTTRWYLQGYECTGGSCTPSVPTTDFTTAIPATGLTVGARVPNTDVLTVRYQRGSGWPVTGFTCSAGGGSITLSPQTGDDSLATSSPHSFSAGNLVLVSDCANPMVLPITSASGSSLSVGSLLAPAPTCALDPTRDTRAFNLTHDFVTVTYYLRFERDDNPDAPRNSAAAQRLVPSLVRRENGVDQVLVQGVDRLDFLYAVQDGSAQQLRYLTAAQVQGRNGGAIACPPPVNTVPGCLWAAVRSVEVHLLVNSIDYVGGLDPDSSSFTYSLDATPRTVVTAPTTLIPGSGLQAGRMMRREFVSLVAVRNNNP